MDLYAALYLDVECVKKYQEYIKSQFPEFELIKDVHLSLCHMQVEGKMPDLYDCFTSVPSFKGVRWDLFEGRFSPYVYLVLVIKSNIWLKNLWNNFDKKFKVEVINGDFHVSLARIKKEEYEKVLMEKQLKRFPKAENCSLVVNTLEIRERFQSEKLLEIRLVR